MRILLALAASVILLAAEPAVAQQCQLQRVASYDMTFTPSGHVAIEMQVNGEPVSLVIDTGGYFSTLDVATADKLKLPRRDLPKTIEVRSVNGRTVSQMTTVPKLSIGPLDLEYVDFLVTRRENNGKFPEGTLSPNILKGFDLDFDFANKKLNFFSQNHCPGQVVYWTSGGAAQVPFKLDSSLHITFPMTLDGKDIEATLDSGAPATRISEPVAYRTFGLAADGPGLDKVEYSDSDGTKQTVYSHKFTVLSVGGVAINYPTIYLIPDAVGAAVRREYQRTDPQNIPQLRQPPLLLGMNEIKFLHLYIAYKERTIYVTAADAH